MRDVPRVETSESVPTPGWIRRLWPYIARQRRDVIIAVLAALGGSAAQTAVPLVAREIVDNVIVDQRSMLWPWLVALVAMALFAFGLAYLRRYRGGSIGLNVQMDLRNDIHDHLVGLDQQSLSLMPTGQLVSRASSDTTLVLGLLNFLPLMTGNVLLMVSSLIVMLILSPVLALVAVIVMPALTIVSYRLRKKVFPATWDGQQREGDVAQIVDEDVNGVRVVKAFGQERRELERLTQTAQRLYGSRMRAVRIQARYQPLLEVIPSLAQVAILAFGGWLALHGHITIGTFLAFSTYVAQFASPARQLAGVLTVAQQARAGVERIFQLLDTRPSIEDRPGAVTLDNIAGGIEFRDVSFGYDGAETHVLTDISLRIEPGERVAFVGASGSGKSTLVSLVSRMHDPTAGSVLLDGHDIRDLALAPLRRGIGVAFEDSFLFSDSVRANIAYGRPDADEAAIKAAAIAAGADFIDALPQGYDTAVGERGLTLSGGQRQRIALARAILANPAVLVLDDATSAVDASTEERIHDALREVLRDRTTLLVAHRVSTLHLADRVVMLDRGRIVDSGTHDDLATRNPAYRALLSGMDGELAAQIGDRIETLSEVAGAEGGVTEAAWTATREARANRMSLVGAPSLGPGLAGGGGRGGGSAGWKLNLAPTPELLAQVAALPPIKDSIAVDLEHESRHDRRFSLGRVIAEFKRPLAIGLVLVVLDALAGLAGPVFVKMGVDDGVAENAGGVLLAATLLFLAVTLGDFAVQSAETLVTGRVAERVMLSLRIRVWAQLQRLSLDYYEREMAGRIMTRMTTDVDQFESLVSNGLLSALVALVTFVGVGVTLVVVNPILGVCTLSVAIPLSIATYFFRRISTRLYDQARDRIAVVNADFQESLSGVREAQAFAHEPLTREHFHHLGRRYFDSRLAAQRLVATYFPFVQFLSSIADVIVLGVGAELIVHGRLSAGALIAFLLYINMFFAPIQQLSQVFDSWQQTRISVKRIADLMVLDTLTPEPTHPVALQNVRGGLALDAVEFTYPGQASAPALTGASLRIQPGETVALVGQTGAGKSTVMKLIARFYDPTAGSVRLDDHDLRDLGLQDLRTHLGYVPQESFLFSGSIRDNIAYGRPEATNAEVEAAARAVGAHDFVAQLPGGYTYEVAERGRTLSAGQRQLIALARAQLVDPPLLLLDEATANLDLATEARVGAAMAQVAHGRTTILIAHRLQTARTADRIAVLDAGRITEVGSHDELVARGGTYASMWRAFEIVSGA